MLPLLLITITTSESFKYCPVYSTLVHGRKPEKYPCCIYIASMFLLAEKVCLIVNVLFAVIVCAESKVTRFVDVIGVMLVPLMVIVPSTISASAVVIYLSPELYILLSVSM